MAKYGGSKDPTYSAVYFPGRYWYAAMSFVYDFGGQIARTKDGKWAGTLDSPQALPGPDRVADDGAPALPREQDRRRGAPAAGARLRQGQGRLVHRQRLGVAVLARPEARQSELSRRRSAPTRCRATRRASTCRRSSAARSSASRSRASEKALAADWIAAFTSTANMTHDGAQGRRDPEHDHARRGSTRRSRRSRPFAEAATSSWFVPATPNWANVESANVLQNDAQRHPPQPGQDRRRSRSRRATESPRS